MDSRDIVEDEPNGNDSDNESSDNRTTDGEPPRAELNVRFDSSETQVVVTLNDKSNADYVDVVFQGHASAKGRLREIGDQLTLTSDALNVSGSAEERTRELGVFNGAHQSDEITVIATAYRGNRSSEVLNTTDRLGSRYVNAIVSYGADEENDRVIVLYSGKGDAEYVKVEFGGDANAVGRLNSEGDRLTLTSDTLMTLGDAENITGETGTEFDGVTDGETVSIRAIAVRGNRRNIVTDVEVGV